MKEFYHFFCSKATQNDLTEKDMQEIQNFVVQKINEDQTIWITQILF